jgi:hypothetical protein
VLRRAVAYASIGQVKLLLDAGAGTDDAKELAELLASD